MASTLLRCASGKVADSRTKKHPTLNRVSENQRPFGFGIFWNKDCGILGYGMGSATYEIPITHRNLNPGTHDPRPMCSPQLRIIVK